MALQLFPKTNIFYKTISCHEIQNASSQERKIIRIFLESVLFLCHYSLSFLKNKYVIYGRIMNVIYI